jgi:hypothetical protein
MRRDCSLPSARSRRHPSNHAPTAPDYPRAMSLLMGRRASSSLFGPQ